MKVPWSRLKDAGWLIAAMNHYRQNGELHLYCTMMKDGRQVTVEGTDEIQVFVDLEGKAGLRPRFNYDQMPPLPWATLKDRGWLIAAMNHLHQDAIPALYCAITKGDRCLVVQDGNDERAFLVLESQAGHW